MKTTNTTPQHNYNYFLELFSIFEKSVEKNDIENINILNEKIFNMLPFKDEEEKENYLNLLQSFKFWDDLKNKTFEIAQRLKKPVLKRSVFNTSVFDWGQKQNKAVSVEGYKFTYNNLKCGLYNANKQADPSLNIKCGRYSNNKNKYIVIDLETGLQIYTIQFKKDIFNIELLKNWIEKAIQKKQDLKNVYSESLKNNYIDYFKNLVKNF